MPNVSAARRAAPRVDASRGAAVRLALSRLADQLTRARPSTNSADLTTRDPDRNWLWNVSTF